MVGGLIILPEGASFSDYQAYIKALEEKKGWLDVDLVHNCFFLGEEMGELFKAVRSHTRLATETGSKTANTQEIAYEIVDILNYLISISNRLDIDIEQAFREKNAINQKRSWSS